MINDMITGAEFFRNQVSSSSIVPSVLLSVEKLSLYSDVNFSSFSDPELCLSDVELPCL